MHSYRIRTFCAARSGVRCADLTQVYPSNAVQGMHGADTIAMATHTREATLQIQGG